MDKYKLGMTREGLQRQQTQDLDGNWADLHLYGMLRTDWECRPEYSHKK